MNIEQELIKLRTDLFDFSKRNPLVHIRQNKLWFPQDEPAGEKPDKLLKKADYHWREYGLATSLAVESFIKWSPPTEKGNPVFYTSPLFYRPAKIKRILKIDTEYSVSISEENYIINPVLRYYFKVFFDFDLPEELTEVALEKERILSFFNDSDSKEKLVETGVLDETNTWQLITKSAVGNFNYKKSALGADYNQIIADPKGQVSALLAGDIIQNEPESDLEPGMISFLDSSQQEVITNALTKNVVIQGPPGTGKSHTIVSLIGAFLLQKKKVLFVSEKRSAMEVVHKRLAKKGLETSLAYFNTQKDQKKAFYQNLRTTWDKVNIASEVANSTKDKSAGQTLFDIYPDLLNVSINGIGTNLNELIEVVLNSQKGPVGLVAYGKTPNYEVWKAARPVLLETEKIMGEAFNSNVIGNCPIVRLNGMVFSEPEVALVLEKRLNSMINHLEIIKAVQDKFDLGDDLDQTVRLALTASILAMVDRVQIDLLNTDSKKYTSFNTWAKKYHLLKSKLGQAEQANQKWSRKPAMSEIIELMDLLTNQQRKRRKGVLSLLRRNPEKLKTSFKDFHSGIADHSKIKLLESVQLEWRLKGELEELEIKLRHNLGINDPANEIDLIYNLRNKLGAVSQNEYVQILEHEQGSEIIRELSALHPDILQFNSQNRFLFQEHDLVFTAEWINHLMELKTAIPAINHWLPELKRFFKLPNEIRQFVRNNPKNVGGLNAVVAYQNMLQETRFHPQFKSLTGWDLITESRQVKVLNESRYKWHAKQINQFATAAQENAEQLLSKPRFKLKDEQKNAKKQYKAQKRLIVHEINKQQRFLSVKSFFEATQNHLLEIQPVWMMNPLTVSEYLPCEKAIFDVVIFDESSQIPLEDSIPAIYRAKQVVVVGDSKQMPPSAFFTSRDETKTILDQAEQVFPNFMLKWHYRSKHPDLIRFSNAEFYNNELVTFPPQLLARPIELYPVSGNYKAGKNPNEAKELANYCDKLIKSVKKSILIIAFSQEQEKEILKWLAALGLVDNGQITVRNLENAQGIESDIVLVSIGYGPNETGDFRLNFGPVNQANGANRLNVLFTRAIEKMIVFTSVKPTDFGYSDNLGVQLLKDFLVFAETEIETNQQINEMPLAHKMVEKMLLDQKAAVTYYPAKKGIGFSSFIHHEKNKILLVDPGIGQDEGKDVLGILSVLHDQYSAVNIVLSLDLWQNFERVKKDLATYFS